MLDIDEIDDIASNFYKIKYYKDLCRSYADDFFISGEMDPMVSESKFESIYCDNYCPIKCKNCKESCSLIKELFR